MSQDASVPQQIRRVRAALWAIEHGDEAAWRVEINALVAWHNQPLLQGLVRLARELEQALGDGRPTSAATLPEACARLEQVVSITEEASHRALDLIEASRTLLKALPDAPGTPIGDAVAAIRTNLSEMTAAQGYQDLTGQVIRRVVALVQAVHSGLDGSTPVSAALTLPQVSSRGHGPALPGSDPPAVTQDDANQLLASLGL